jgi:hypothetical protein
LRFSRIAALCKSLTRISAAVIASLMLACAPAKANEVAAQRRDWIAILDK